MSFDLAVWEGTRPVSDEAAAEEFEERMERLEDDDEPAPPSAAIRAYVAELLGRWPDITTPEGEDSPWSVGPLLADASGSMIYFPMQWDRAEEASAFAAEVAARHGLVCFDPQSGTLR